MPQSEQLAVGDAYVRSEAGGTRWSIGTRCIEQVFAVRRGAVSPGQLQEPLHATGDRVRRAKRRLRPVRPGHRRAGRRSAPGQRFQRLEADERQGESGEHGRPAGRATRLRPDARDNPRILSCAGVSWNADLAAMGGAGKLRRPARCASHRPRRRAGGCAATRPRPTRTPG